MTRPPALPSMSRWGDCCVNAHAESRWRRLRIELSDGGSFPGLAEARLKIRHFLAYHNAECRRFALGYQEPNYFETRFRTISQLCPDWLDHLTTTATGIATARRSCGPLSANPAF